LGGLLRGRSAALLLSLAAAGCAALPPTEEERAALGAVAVVPGDGPFPVDVSPPVAGWGAGLGYGTLRGMGGLVVFPLAGAGEGHLPGLVLGAAFAVAWFPVSMIGGAVTAESVREVADAEEVIRPVVEDPGLPGVFAGGIEREIRNLGDREIVPPESATTLLEVRILSLGRGPTWDLWTLDRPFTFKAEVEVRVVRRADGSEIWRGQETVPGPADAPPKGAAGRRDRTWSEWASDGGGALRAEVRGLLERGAQRLVFRIFREATVSAQDRPVLAAPE